MRDAMRNAMRFLLPAGLAVAVLAIVGVWWFLRDDAPAEVSIDAATAAIDEQVSASASEPSTAAAATGDLSGVWTVDTETGGFDYESATGSFVGFRIEEELQRIGTTTAVGRTGDVSGSITIDGTTVTATEIDIDLTTITTDDSRRDDNVQDALETGSFPTASFRLTDPIAFGDVATGETVSAVATGEMTIHGVTQETSFDLDARLVDDTIVVVGSTDITFADYDMAVPDSGIIISVDDFGVLELQLLLTRA